MAIITVPKTHAVSALQIPDAVAVLDECKLLPLENSSNAIAVAKKVAGAPTLFTATLVGTTAVNWINGVLDINLLSNGKLDFKQFIDSWGGENSIFTEPSFSYDNALSKQFKDRVLIDTSAFLLKRDDIDIHTLEKISYTYNDAEKYTATLPLVGVTVDCVWGNYLAGDGFDFFKTPYQYYASDSSVNFSKEYYQVKPNYQYSDLVVSPTASPYEVSKEIVCSLPMGGDFIAGGNIVLVTEINETTVPETADPDTIYLSEFRDSNGKISPQSVACKGWGNKQHHVLHQSWNFEPDSTLNFFVSADGQNYSSYYVTPKTSAWGSTYRFSVLAKVDGVLLANRPNFGVKKYAFTDDGNYVGIEYGGPALQEFPILTQDSGTGILKTSGTITNNNLSFYTELNFNRGNIRETDFYYRNTPLSVLEIDSLQVGYSFKSTTASLPVPAVTETPYTPYPENFDSYKLEGVPTGQGKSFVQNVWGRTIIWNTFTPDKMYALFRNGKGYIEIDLTPLETPTGYEPYAFQCIGKLFLLVWKNDADEYLHKIVFLAIWLEGDRILVDLDKMIYNPLICYSPTLQRFSPLTKVM